MALLSLVVATALLGHQEPPKILDAPRLRTILKSGAVTLVERLPNTETCSVQLWATGRECAETVETHGRRHLLEHLVAKGKTGDLDMRLETRGMYLTAQTSRDSMKFEITCSPKDLPFATRAIREILEPIETTPEAIAKEAKIIEQELALRGPAMALSALAWTQGYGNAGLDSLGSISVMSATTPEDLKALQAKQFDRRSLALVITGPVELAEASILARDALGEETTTKKPPEPGRPTGNPGAIDSDLPGEARGAFVPSVDNERAIWTLAAGMALASQYDLGIFYTPTDQNGMIVLTSLESGAMTRYIDELDEGLAQSLWFNGLALVSAWLRTDGSPSAVASLRGSLLAQRVDLRPERFLEIVQRMTPENFMVGFDAFKLDRAVAITGTAPPLPPASPPTSLIMSPSADRVRSKNDPPLVLRISETPQPSARVVVADAFISASGLTGKERAALAVLGEALLEGTQEYTKAQLLEYGTQAGIAPRVQVLPDFLWIQVALPRDGLDVAIGILESLIRRPSLRNEDLVRILARHRNVPPSIWQQALDPSVLDYARVKLADVREIHLRLFRPENTRFSVAGSFGPGAAEKAIKETFATWNPRRAPKSVPDAPAKPLWLRKPLVATFELRTDPFRLSEPEAPARVLATSALGVGKGSSMFRTLREANAWTYRQEAILWPTMTGWQVRLIAAQASIDGQQNMPERIRKVLLDDIANWTEAHLARALGMLEAGFNRKLEVNPFATGLDDILGAGPPQTAFWTGIGDLQAGPAITVPGFVEAMRGVTLEQLKAAATQIVTDARPIIVYGGKLPEIPEAEPGAIGS
ncbi:MAG: insulinase family protein [Fimbriimonadaceae bacterium]|nr:insulinase family protein [Fimbriimonadaceae bacterium]